MPNGQGQTCVVCGQTIDGSWVYHARLDVFLHGDCPMTNVRGEDISTHTVLIGRINN